MTPRAFPSRRLSATLLVLSVLFAAPTDTAQALETLATGVLTDSSTGQPVVGAALSVKRGSSEVGSASSNAEGRFTIPISFPGNESFYVLSLSVEHDDYSSASEEVVVANGSPTQADYEIRLFPVELAQCLPRPGASINMVVVGHFIAPGDEQLAELSQRLAEALQFDLITRMQTAHMPAHLQPIFAPCDGARVQIVTQGKDLARALRAHALLHGSVSRDAASYQVNTHVSDAYDVSVFPATATSKAVDLANPSLAKMNPETYAAVLSAVAAGLVIDGNCSGALAVAAAAETITDDTPAFVSIVRQRCGLTQ